MSKDQGYVTEQRRRIRWKLQTARGRTQESVMAQQGKDIRHAAKLLTEIQTDLQMLAIAAVAYGKEG